jgi:phenylpyruvate tautomerase PptA (4-oxalocrotonate tautomerase family)
VPLWHIYCPRGTYSPQDKRALAARITDLYADYGLPRFLVGVVFREVPKGSFLFGGEPAGDFVRISID